MKTLGGISTCLSYNSNLLKWKLPSLYSAVIHSPSQTILNYKSLIHQVSNGEQLTNSHINAGNQVLKSLFPDFQGPSSPVLGQTFFPKFEWAGGYAGQSYVQVLHNGSDNRNKFSGRDTQTIASLNKLPQYFYLKKTIPNPFGKSNFNRTPLIVGYMQWHLSLFYVIKLTHLFAAIINLKH